MGYPATEIKKSKWSDYISSKDELPYEVIDGTIYDMSPSSSERHQRILGNFYVLLRENLKNSQCVVYIAPQPLLSPPINVYLDEYNFVQPDIFVVCDKTKIKDRIYGPPDIIMEILSSLTVTLATDTAIKDKKIKKALYEKFGVKEYIIIHPEEALAGKYIYHEGRYNDPEIFDPEDLLHLSTIDVRPPLKDVFES